MSVRPQFGRKSPHANGWRIVDQPEDDDADLLPETYRWIAYQHPDSPTTWFAAAAGVIWLDDKDNDEPYHGELVSLVRHREIPRKPDRNIFAIPYREAMRIQTLEVRFWADYNDYLAVYRYQGHKGAIAYAHRKVLERQL